jgi:hypothetical protein
LTPWAHLDLPAWVADPNTQVLFITTESSENSPHGFILVNASNGERFTFPPSDAGGYFWMADGKHLGFLSKDKIEATLVDIFDGSVVYYPASDQATRFVTTSSEDRSPLPLIAPGSSQAPFPFIASGSSLDTPGFTLWEKYQRGEFSQDGRYRINEDYDHGATSIIDLKTGESIQVTDPTDNLYDYMPAWSPIGSFLGIVQSNVAFDNYMEFDTTLDITLKVYDAENRRMVGSYKSVNFPGWSPDGTKFLYQPISEVAQYSWVSPPCIYDMLDDSNRCYNEAVIRHKTDNLNELGFVSVEWLPDQSGIGYIYYAIIAKPQKIWGGLCFIRFQDGSEYCMLQDFMDPGQNVIDFELSPDGNFADFIMDKSCPGCYYIDNPQLGIVDVHTGEYFIIGDNDVGLFSSGLWRPKLSP